MMETEPGALMRDDDAILESGFMYGGPGYHASRACAMGPHDEHVVASDLKVRVVNRLRVVDVSVLPTMVSGNLNAPIMAIAWRAAERIRSNREMS